MIVQNMYPLYTLYSDPIPVTMHYFHSIFTYNPVVEIQTHPWMKMPTLSPTSRDGERLPLKTSKEQNTQELSKERLATKKLQKQMWIRSSTILPRCSKPSPSPSCSQGSSSPSPQGPPPPLSLKVATALLNLDLQQSEGSLLYIRTDFTRL